MWWFSGNRIVSHCVFHIVHHLKCYADKREVKYNVDPSETFIKNLSIHQILALKKQKNVKYKSKRKEALLRAERLLSLALGALCLIF